MNTYVTLDHKTSLKSLGYICSNSHKCNLGSLEIRVSTYISAKLKKRTYMYDSLQFPVEINTRGSKTLTTFIPFHTKYDLQEQF